MKRMIKFYSVDGGYVLAFRLGKRLYLFSLWPFGHFGRIK